MRRARWPLGIGGTVLALLCLLHTGVPARAADGVQYWKVEFPRADFNKRSISLADIRSDGARKDAIPPIIRPIFRSTDEITGMGDTEPVLTVEYGSDAKAYPLRILLWHEIVNDRIGDLPILVTYAPLTNSAAAFERVFETRRGPQTLSFGNTSRLRHFNTLMYDHQSQTWWQQFTGEAVMGVLTGLKLKPLASRIEAFGRFRAENPFGQVLVPADPKARPYGQTPFVQMDTSPGDGLDAYLLAEEINPYDRVLVVDGEAWAMKLLREKGTIEHNGVAMTWSKGQNSVHDSKWISFGRDVGSVTVRRFDPETEEWENASHLIGFAFAYRAFRPESPIYTYVPGQ